MAGADRWWARIHVALGDGRESRHTQELLPPVIRLWDRELAREAGDLVPAGRPVATVCFRESPSLSRGLSCWKYESHPRGP